MSRKERIECDCGGELSRPVPTRCPHCGARIVAIRRRRPLLVAFLIIGSIFAALVAFLHWMLSSPGQ
jgi:hypothetical protein